MQEAAFSITVQDLARMRDDGEPVCILDIREPWEVAICAIPGSMHVPLAKLAQCVDDLPSDRPVVALCHHGARSARATTFLRSKGLALAVNLEGGIDAWAVRIDPTVRLYD